MNNANSFDEAQPVFAKKLGEVLAETRNQQSLTIEDVADHLCIKVVYLTAIEHNQFDVISNPTQLRSFIRAYARFLDIDGGQIIKNHQQELPVEIFNSLQVKTDLTETKPRDYSHQVPLSRVFVFILSGAVLIIGGWLGYSQIPSLQKMFVPSVKIAEQNLPDQETLTVPNNDVDSLENNIPSATSKTVINNVSTGNDLADSDTTKNNPKDDTIDNSETSVNEMQLRLKVKKDAWISIKDKKENNLLRKVLLADEEKAIVGVPPFRVILGNASTTTLFINGDPVVINNRFISDANNDIAYFSYTESKDVVDVIP